MEISVLINNYNYAEYITECLNSVSQQTRVADEVIVVDDGSTDHSVEVIKANSRRLQLQSINPPATSSAF